jgi:hypothetical protein
MIKVGTGADLPAARDWCCGTRFDVESSGAEELWRFSAGEALGRKQDLRHATVRELVS